MPPLARNSIHMSRLVLRMRAVSRVLVICVKCSFPLSIKADSTYSHRVKYSSQIVGKQQSTHVLCIHSESYV